MKFPKERVFINSKIKEYLSNEDHFSIRKLKDEILSNYETLDNYAFENLIRSTFIVGDFDQTIIIFSDLFQKGIETFPILYYGFLSFLANTDIYQVLSYIRKSTLLQSNNYQEYTNKEGANYSNILYLSKLEHYATLTLILINFIEGISREVIGNIEIDQEYILFRFFDLINMLFEIGYPVEIISSLSSSLRIIYNLDM